MWHRNINVYYTCGFLNADASVRHNNLGSQSLQGKNWTSSSIFHPWQSRVKLLALDLQSLQVHQDHGVFVDCPASWVHIAHKLPPPMSFSQSMNFANELFIIALKPTSPPKPHDFSNAKRHVCVMASACGASYAFTSSHGKALGSKTWRWHWWVQSPGGPGFLRMHSMGAFAQIEILLRTFPPSAGLKRRPPVGSAGVPRRAGALARWHGRGGSRQWAPAPIAGEGLDVWWQCFFLGVCSAGDPFHQMNWSTLSLSLSLPRLRLFCRMGYINFKLQGNTASGDVEWDSMRLAMSPGWKASSEPAWRGPCLWPGEIRAFIRLSR